MQWTIKAYSKSNLIMIKKLKKIAAEKTSFPLHDVFFAPIAENDKLAYFDQHEIIIVLSDKLMIEDDDTIEQIFLHELAHFIQYKLMGYTAHDKDFRQISKNIGIDKNFSHSMVPIEQKQNRLSKIAKLLALSNSSELFEAESALKKAQELIAKTPLSKNELSSVYETTLTFGKNISTVDVLLANMAKLITPVFLIKTFDEIGKRNLKCYGNFDSIMLFTYLYDFFSYTVDKEYCEFIKNGKIKASKSDRINYYHGIYKTLEERLCPQTDSPTARSLVKLNSDIEKITKQIMFPKARIGKANSRFSYNGISYKKGFEDGKKLKILLPIEKKKTKETLLIK